MNIVNSKRKTLFIFFILLCSSIIFRFPTLFNDYYDVDELSAIIQTHEYVKGDIPGEDFAESKLPVYHYIFKIAYFIYPEKLWIPVHIITIFIIFLTSIFIYLIGIKICSKKTGIIAALSYTVLISSFNRHFMATNGEIIYNLPVTASFYFILLSIRNSNKIMQLLLFCISILFSIVAVQIKFHGAIIFIFIFIFYLFYKPYFLNKKGKIYYILLSVFILGFMIFIAYYSQSIQNKILKKIFYATAAKGLNPLFFLAKYIHRQGMLTLWHFAIWIPAYIYVFKYVKNKFLDTKIDKSALILLFLLCFIMIFGGGLRLYFHYFMAVYPTLCLIGAISLKKYGNINIIAKIRNNFIKLILIPGLFFLSWNTKDVIIKHFFPNAFYNEGKILFLTRAVLIASFNDYLLPEKSYLNTIHYIENNTKKDDRIFVWGDGPYLYYFSNRRMGGYTLWPKNRIIYMTKYYNDKEKYQKARNKELAMIKNIHTKKPVLFIDTSGNGLSNFNFKIPPLLKKYLKKYYSFKTNVDNMKIYKRIDK